MRRTCRCISAPWTAPSTSCGGSTPTSHRATSMRSTRPTTAARICPTSRWSRRCLRKSPLPPCGGELERRESRRRPRSMNLRLRACRLPPPLAPPRKGEGEILFWVASRGHHADVGGTAPGSMTPRAKTVDEEGVLIDNFKLVERGRFREAELHEAPHRSPLSLPQPDAEHRRPQGADRCQREGRRRDPQDGAAVRARRRATPT